MMLFFFVFRQRCSHAAAFVLAFGIGRACGDVRRPAVSIGCTVAVEAVFAVDDLDQPAAPVTPELVGGAVLDENGYMIGLASEKVRHTDESGNTVYAKNAVRAIGSQVLIEYIDAVSARLQIAIPYTVAVLGGEA